MHAMQIPSFVPPCATLRVSTRAVAHDDRTEQIPDAPPSWSAPRLARA
eukprot:IDg19593t1